MWGQIKRAIEGGLGLVVIGSWGTGLVVPGLDLVPAWAVFVPLVGLVWTSCASVSLAELHAIRPTHALGFFAARFLALPLALYVVAGAVLPAHQDAIFLLALAPAAASGGAWTGAFGGSTTLALGYTVVSSLAAPVVIPGALAAVGYEGASVGGWTMLATLAGVILGPIAAFFALARPVPQLARAVRGHSALLRTACLAAIIVIAVGQKREAIFAEPWAFLAEVPVMAGLFAVLFAFGWLYPARGRAERVSHTVASGLNNNSLMIGLSAMYFAPHVALAILSTSIVWNFLFLALKRFLGGR